MTRSAPARGATLAAALLSLAACSNAPVNREPPPLPFTGTKWLLVTERPVQGESPYLEFGDGAVTGYSGCNRIMGRYVQDAVGAGAIVFSSIATSKRMCDPVAMAIEDRMMNVLRSSTSLRVIVDTLRIDGSAGYLELRGIDSRPAQAPAATPKY